MGSWYEPDSSSASEATNDRLSLISLSSLPPNETRGMLVRTGENSLWGRVRYAGVQLAQAHSSPSVEILCPAAYSSQVPGRKKSGRREGWSCSLKRKIAASAERRDSCHRISDIPSPVSAVSAGNPSFSSFEERFQRTAQTNRREVTLRY